MNWKIFFIALTGAALLTSCQTARQATPSSMVEGEWKITEVNGSAIKAQSSPYIGFNTQEKRVYGNFGCNRISGSFDFNGKNEQIEFGQMLSTMMACPDMELEQSILQELNSVECIKFSDNEHVALCDKNRNPLIQMERRFHTPSFGHRWQMAYRFRIWRKYAGFRPDPIRKLRHGKQLHICFCRM